MQNSKKVLCPFCFNMAKGDVPSKYRAYVYGLNNHVKGAGFKCFRCDKTGHASIYYHKICETWEDLELVDTSNINLDILSSISKTDTTIETIRPDVNIFDSYI